MPTEQYRGWKATHVRTPADVPTGTPLLWLAERHSEHTGRLLNRDLPPDLGRRIGRGGQDDALALLALGVEIGRTVAVRRGNALHRALLLGATWAEAAAALDVTPAEARTLLHEWADRQNRVHTAETAEGRSRPLGISTADHTTALALIELGDHERRPV